MFQNGKWWGHDNATSLHECSNKHPSYPHSGWRFCQKVGGGEHTRRKFTVWKIECHGSNFKMLGVGINPIKLPRSLQTCTVTVTLNCQSFRKFFHWCTQLNFSCIPCVLEIELFFSSFSLTDITTPQPKHRAKKNHKENIPPVKRSKKEDAKGKEVWSLFRSSLPPISMYIIIAFKNCQAKVITHSYPCLISPQSTEARLASVIVER